MIDPVAFGLGIVGAVDARFPQDVQVAENGSAADIHLLGKVLGGAPATGLQNLNNANQSVSAGEFQICLPPLGSTIRSPVRASLP